MLREVREGMLGDNIHMLQDLLVKYHSLSMENKAANP